jgi:hypothetical protein
MEKKVSTTHFLYILSTSFLDKNRTGAFKRDAHQSLTVMEHLFNAVLMDMKSIWELVRNVHPQPVGEGRA